MSYAVRNTLILLVVLIIIIGAGWSYIYFVQEPEIEKLSRQVETKRTELQNKQQIASQFPQLQKQYEQSAEFFNNYPKALYGSSNEDSVFHFLNSINSGASYTDFTFAFSDSANHDKYGILTMNITGQGSYRNVANFVRHIELNKPLNKIDQLSINPINEPDAYGTVSFKFIIKSFYDRVKMLGKPEIGLSGGATLASVYNPFFPLIRSVEKNDQDLINIEASKLLAISGDQVFLLDQHGVMQKLSKGEEVYLGRLSSINVGSGTATFLLNKGGIVEHITLQVNKEGNQSE